MHTENFPVTDDPWQQWQAFAAAFTPAGSALHMRSALGGASAFAPFAAAAEQFAAAARAYIDSAARSADWAAATDAFGGFLREQFADFQMPWSGGLRAGAGSGSAPASSFDSPALGATREQQQRLQRMAEAWRRMDEAQRRLQRLWSDALREAAMAFTARLVPPPAEPSNEALRKLYDAWIDCAEDAYNRVAHTEVFCNALAEFINASSEWRRELQAGMEHWAKSIDLPTRSELNTLMQRLKSVEQRLRATPARKARRGRSKTKS
jgi:hypothetical protein